MSWFSGNIPEAIAESQTKAKLFVVYVTGEDEASTSMDSLWNDGKIVEICQSSCVCLKLIADSEESKQFSAIYPVLCVPSAYFIGNNGRILEALAAQSSADEMYQKIEGVVETFKSNSAKPKPGPSSSSASTSGSVQSDKEQQSTADSVASSSSTEPVKKKSEEEIKQEVDRLQQKIQEKRELEAQKKKEKEKNAETERRELGRNIQKLKDAQKNTKLKQDIDERKRDKMEEKAARERVKRQIEQDKIDRAERFKQDKLEREGATIRKQGEEKNKNEEKQRQEIQEKSLHARLQFRMPDGSSFSNQFEATDTLQTACSFVVSQKDPAFPTLDSFELVVPFPRRAFTADDRSSTLAQLGLTPSAALTVLPCQRRYTSPSGDNSIVSQIGAFLLFILMIPVQILKYLWAFISGPTSTTNQPASNRSPVRAGPSTSNSGDGLRRRGIGSSMDTRRQGNMTRLHDVKRDDNDEDDATWNGNSTQQM